MRIFDNCVEEQCIRPGGKLQIHSKPRARGYGWFSVYKVTFSVGKC